MSDSLTLISETERHQLLVEWNNTLVDYPRDKCIHQLFEAQVELTPDAVAVVFEDKQLTYSQLNARANQLAHYLQKLGVKPDVLVSICVERSLEMIVGLLGILKAGGAYVPLDPAYPAERLAYMLSDSQVKVLLTQEKLASSLPVSATRVICLDSNWQNIDAHSEENPLTEVKASNLAYVIYTSGSTGKPKGVMIEHQSIVNFTSSAITIYNITQSDRVLQFASIAFDAAVIEIFPCLSAGGTLVLRTDDMLLSGSRFVQRCREWEITMMDWPTSHWHQVMGELAAAEQTLPESLRVVSVGGDAVLPETLKLWQRCVKELANPPQLLNGYGPTETTAVATYYDLSEFIAKNPAASCVPIGTPIGNLTTYILNHHLQPVPIGVPGELHIGGTGLARGYLGRPDLTAEKFIPNPFSHEPEARLYKTGDQARYLPDGNIEFLGRIDNQVKIRGFRIEPGEIEAALSQHSDVREAAVIAREDIPGEKRLVAYFVPNQKQPTIGELRHFLKEKLPYYMVPAAFVTLDALPLTLNGKVDRRALPAPLNTRPELEETFVAPSTPIEEKLAKIWAEVLGIQHLGVNDNFFHLGGHSLTATQFLSRVRDVLQVELPFQSIFESPTIANFAKLIEQESCIEQQLPLPSIQPMPRHGNLPTSFAQERVYFIEQLAQGNSAYQYQETLRLKGKLDVAALQQSLSEIVRRHEIFRTTFPAVDGRVVQVVHLALPIILPVVDLQTFSESERSTEAQRLIDEEVQKPFDLNQLPLIRWVLLRLSDQEHVLIHVEHHMLHDGWSLNVFLGELVELYQAFSLGNPSPLSEPLLQFVDFAYWQREWVKSQEAQDQQNYWKQKLSGSSPLLKLPYDRPRPEEQSYHGSLLRIELPISLCESLKVLNRQEGSTLFMTMFAAFLILLHRYTGQDDLSVGSGVANRRKRETEGLIGMIVNTIVLRTDLSGNPTFRELLGRVRSCTLEAYTNEDLPFDKVVEALKPVRNLSYNPLYQVVFSFHNAPLPELNLPGLNISLDENVSNKSAKFDLNIIVIPRSEQRVGRSSETGEKGITVFWEYNTDLFDAATIERMVENYQTLLESIVANQEHRVSELPLLTEAQQHQLLVEWNKTQREYPKDKCIHQLFEEQVERSPDAIAVVFEEEQLTYRELNQRANRIAHHLKTLGVGPEILVGICVERSLEMVVGLLGILKAGGAYVPLDPTYPTERLHYMLEDAEVQVLLTQGRLVESLPKHKARVVCLDILEQSLALLSKSNPISRVTPDNLAYVIYTSGSTGKPKGVMNTHRGVCNRLLWMQQAYQLTSGDRVLQKTPFSFDVSVWEFFWILMTGGRLVVAKPGGHQESAYLLNLILEQQITTLHFVPSMLQIFLEEPGVESCSCLRRVICSGEALPKKLQDHFFARLGCELHNLYGPTEAAIDVTFWQCQPDSNLKTVPIGRPIANTQIYILDQYLQPVPVGVVGELHIGGVGVARGYLNRPDLTTQKFIPDPFSEQPEARLYKTGDKARYLSDGTIEYLGRIDNQVKIRGLRIELGEIESVLSQHLAVQETVAIVREDNPSDKRLVAYIVPDFERAFTVRQLLNLEKDGRLNSHLRYELPNGMVIVHLNHSETDFVYQEIFEEKTYLKHGITLNSKSCIFDVGANIGMFSLFMAQTCKDAVIYAFEPIPPVFEVLSLNASLYGLNIKLFDCGLSSEEMDDEFTYYPNVSVISGRFANATDEQEVVKSFLLNQQSIGNGQTALSSAEIDELLAERLTSQRFNCHLKTISSVIRENGIAQIDLLKIDAEKSEMFVLAGIEEEDWSKIRQIIVEVHDIDGRLEQITTLLKKHGYELTLEQDALLKDTGLYNIYAVRHSLKVQEVPEKTSSMSASDDSLIWTNPKRLISDVRNRLTQKLPDYMVPGAFVLLPSLPLTANGKVDRRALPAPSFRNDSDSFVLPSTSTEEILVDIWKDVLGLETVGVHDNFFELGGDSILSIQIISKANIAGLLLTPKQIFQHQTIAQLAAIATTTETKKAFQGLVTGSLPLTPIQHWFFAQNFREPHHFNQAFLLKVSSTLNPDLLQQALQQLLLHHDALRLRFNQSEACWQQFNALPDETIPFSLIDLSTLQEEALSQTIESTSSQLQASLNLNSGPLLRVALFHLGTQKSSRLLLVIHHLAVDGVSWRILLEDLQTAYQQLSSGKPIQLPAKTTSFKHWAEKLTEYAQSPTATKELTYWSNISTSKITPLPVDCKGGANTEASARSVKVSLNEEETRALLQEIHKAYHTQINDILLTALVQVLATWSGCNSVLIDLEGHGREEILPDVDLSRTVGWFTTIFPVLLELKATENIADGIKSIKEQLRAIPNRGIGYGLLRYLSGDAEITSQLSSFPHAEVSFNYLGQFDWGMQSDSFVKLAPESVGLGHSQIGQRSHLLEINGLVVENQLQLEWTYSENFHSPATIESLAQDFAQALRTLIAHCLSADARGYTPDVYEQTIHSSAQQINNYQRRENKVPLPLHLLELPENISELLPSDTESAYPLAKMQEFMLHHYCNDHQKMGVYHTQQSYEIYDESLDLNAFKKALEISVQKHPALRTVFVTSSGKPAVQVVKKNLRFFINEKDISHIKSEEQSNYIDAVMKRDRQNLFNIENPNEALFRFGIFQKAENKFEFLMSIHHAIIDGWGNIEFLNKLYELYLTLKKGEEITVVPGANVYKEFVALEKEIIGSLSASNFWKLHLKDYTYKPKKPLTTSVAQVEAVAEKYNFEEEIIGDVRKLCRNLGVSPKALFLSSYLDIIGTVMKSNRVCVGIISNGRTERLSDPFGALGLFWNIVPLCQPTREDKGVQIQNVQQSLIDIEPYVRYPLLEILANQQKTELFFATFNFVNFHNAKNIKADTGLKVNARSSHDKFNFPLNYAVSMSPVEGNIRLSVEYDKTYFSRQEIRSMIQNYIEMIRAYLRMSPRQ
ncbi:amino acid adenylation domain-containing protein [Nostoc muscorum FACHB-395]|nr:amino acid adenylation domain-containing protein [Desmonostoc muscorum FACHB-395]